MSSTITRRKATALTAALVAVAISGTLAACGSQPATQTDAGTSAATSASTSADAKPSTGVATDIPYESTREGEALTAKDVTPDAAGAEQILNSGGSLAVRSLEAAKIYKELGPDYTTEYEFCFAIYYIEAGNDSAALPHLNEVPDDFELCGYAAKDFKA